MWIADCIEFDENVSSISVGEKLEINYFTSAIVGRGLASFDMKHPIGGLKKRVSVSVPSSPWRILDIYITFRLYGCRSGNSYHTSTETSMWMDTRILGRHRENRWHVLNHRPTWNTVPPIIQRSTFSLLYLLITST